MLNDISSNQQVYLVTSYTDLRRSIDGLAMIIQGQLRLDPFRRMGNPARIAKLFGGKEGYLRAVKELEEEIYRIG